jgi:Fe-S cluster assembly ATPase SufC
MKISSIEVERFKKVKKAEIELGDINVLIGSNNAGKSSVLQGIHFSIVTSVSARRLGKKTFTQDNLLYCPTRNFVTLRNGAGYQNQSNFGYLRIRAEVDDDEDIYTVRVYRGRNDGNVGCERSGNPNIGLRVTDTISPFSIYVPGLAGIPQTEEYRSESVVRKGVASGDANLYLRNVIYLIKKKKLLSEMTRLMKMVFPEFSVAVNFDPTHDSYIDVLIGLKNFGEKKHLELVGTGVLQALQIFSYVTLFKPALLLLDEPDSHLHPDNQTLLTDALLTLSHETETKIIISTHSRHIVDSLYGEANFVWLKDGEVFEQGKDLHRLSMLMDIGALDSFEKLREGAADYVILTEDSKMESIKILAKSSGLDIKDIIFYSYKASTNINSAGTLTGFLKDIAPETEVVVHADNDFLTQDEQERLEQKIRDFGATPFVTEGSDIESYFVSPEHISSILDEDVETIKEWLDEIATEHHNELTHKYSRKRDEAKRKNYKNPNDAPETINLIGSAIPLPEAKRLGKFMLRRVRSSMQDKFGKTVDLIQESDSLFSDALKDLE